MALAQSFDSLANPEAAMRLSSYSSANSYARDLAMECPSNFKSQSLRRRLWPGPDSTAGKYLLPHVCRDQCNDDDAGRKSLSPRQCRDKRRTKRGEANPTNDLGALFLRIHIEDLRARLPPRPHPDTE
ncbi:hypothetical protein PUNSTDRAFT_54880 [Punctularia strigosozonata HHB-11173 SS5]|uniref:uncharacterized protein n=1 Tax=Punctularia strigosozonata (strain HHB-11173) TaxID=741275 RepID=UPI0004416D38|nr:uncharacterized protein PUNSTDRAFT_54880 [Punctularia strigosozonata HHB-11173 SS5]EIN05486.1 hypothetical protein PUNSTDRAFT_54880 [Punctularia strigosozonata HHB-11173 SS5]